MNDKPKKRYTQVAGHGLLHEGRIETNMGWVSDTVGPGQCSCGEESEPLTTGAARKRWHQQHKAKTLAARRGS